MEKTDDALYEAVRFRGLIRRNLPKKFTQLPDIVVLTTS